MFWQRQGQWIYFCWVALFAKSANLKPSLWFAGQYRKRLCLSVAFIRGSVREKTETQTSRRAGWERPRIATGTCARNNLVMFNLKDSTMEMRNRTR